MFRLRLRQKLWLGFGGLLAVLLTVGGLGIVVVTRNGHAVERIMHENYDTIVYCQRMSEAADELDSVAKAKAWGEEFDPGKAAAAVQGFELNLRSQQGNVTVPGERKETDILARRWAGFKQEYTKIMQADLPSSERRALYVSSLLPLANDLHRTLQRVIDLNLGNIVSVDGQVRHLSRQTRYWMIMLLAVGGAVGTLFVLFTSRSILGPVQELTRGAREIGQGNLDIVVQAQTNDEVGQLAQSFNAMAEHLRTFRRSDRARVLRLQHTTQQAIDSLPAAVAVLDIDGHVEMANRAAQATFGIKADLRAEDVPDSAWLVELFRAVTQHGRTVEPKDYGSAIQRFVEGEERFFLPNAFPIVDHEKHLVGATIILTDVTRLRHLDSLKAGMVATVAHQLKTPLTSLRMAVHLLLDEKIGTLNPKQEELLITAREDCERLSGIMDGLMDLGRIEAGAQMEFEALSPFRLVSDAVDEFRTAFQDKDVALVVDLPGDLPDVWADHVRVLQVFVNLLSNALKYTPAGGTVTVAARALGDDVEFTVTDTGIGISEKYVSRIFEMFFRVPEQPATGAGLGLAIAREIVAAHGGRITVQSKEGAGSTFSFTLKRADRLSNPANRSVAGGG